MSRLARPLLTRDAEGLFWMARYMERVENLARLIDITQTFESPGFEAEAWSASRTTLPWPPGPIRSD